MRLWTEHPEATQLDRWHRTNSFDAKRREIQQSISRHSRGGSGLNVEQLGEMLREAHWVPAGKWKNPANSAPSLKHHIAAHAAAKQAWGTTRIKLRYEGVLSEMDADGHSWVGAIFKSKAIQHLELQGRFSDFVLTLEGAPFAGRTPIGTHPSWSEGCVVDVRKRAQEEDKPAGCT